MTLPEQPSLTDAELQALLRSLREDVAAPQGFSRQVLQRLEAAGLVSDSHAPAPAQPARGSWLRLPALRWGLGLSGALALVLAWFAQPVPQALPSAPTAQAPVTAAQAPSEPKVLAAARPKASVRAQKAEPAVQVAQAALAPAPAAQAAVEAPLQVAGSAPVQEAVAVGSAAAAPALSASHAASAGAATAPMPSFAGASSAGAPAAPASAGAQAFTAGTPGNPDPTATPLPLRANSELRNNVMRASRGEKARLLFRLQKEGQVRIDIHDRLGARMAVLHDGVLSAGEYGADGRFSWDGRDEQGQDAPSGIYELRLVGPDLAVRHKLVVVR